MHAFGQILKTETKLYLWDLPTLLLTVLLPAGILTVLGLIPSFREPDPNFGGQSFLTYFTPSLLVASFGSPLPQHPWGFAAALVLGTAALLALGLVIAAVAGTGSAQAMSVPLFMVVMFFGGVYLPRFLLPDVLADLGAYLPPGVQALLDAWTGTAPEPLHLGIMAAIALTAGTVAAKLFRWQ
ncbi:ABC transporter permease [Micromonospora craniellae]|uniref:ABC transporter permease n=1 Tax=Micromonospora craniellae TaxID=2294034 RepID=A0A372FWX5_9ACTN|nr:ABC transporter permease [Micromonospora craniellae]QOC90113.1 ABC transporter permease [Micromonospora craniellae]RFS45307.1 ABC transporter permease [Micromonospora craniellae]